MRFRFLLLTVLLCLSALPTKAFALDVQAVRFGVYQDKIRLVLDMDQKVDFRTFVLGNPYRMVIDLPSFNWRAGQIEGPENAGVQATRHGNLQPGISRIVFDMNRPIGIQNAFSLPPAEGKPHRLVIDFANVTPSIFKTVENKVFGDLKPDTSIAESSYVAPPVPKPGKEQAPLVIIDPGHGGIDPGAVGANKVYEKHVVLKLGKELAAQLKADGYRVLMTRETDVFIKLSDRVKFARKHGGDLFISIHADSLENHNVRGASIYTLSEKASDAQTARLAARENKADLIAGIDLSVEDQDVANILVDLAMRETSNQSNFFANTLVDNFKTHSLRLLQTPHRSAGFAVLKAPDIPSVLVEAGFMSNRKEAEMLNSSSHRKQIASALKKGVDRYFEQVRKNQRI